MKQIELGSLSDGSEAIGLLEKASKLMALPVGQKILRELNAFNALAHMDKAWIQPPKGREYSTDDYQKYPGRFSITEFYPVVYFIQDNLLLTTGSAFIHRERLENQIAEEMPDLNARLQQPETLFVLGDTFRVKGTDIRFLAVRGEPALQLKKTKGIVARQLAKHGVLLLFWYNDTEWEDEQLKKPEFARYAEYKKRCDEASSRSQLMAEWGDILLAFGGYAPDGPERRYKWTIISPN